MAEVKEETLTAEQEFEEAAKAEENKEESKDAEKANEEESTSTSEVDDVSSQEEESLDPEKFDEGGVPWKNRAKEYEKKYHKKLEEITQAVPGEKTLSKEELIEKTAKDYNISEVDVPGFVALAQDISAAAIRPLLGKISNYEFRELKSTAKKEVAVNYPDFANLDSEIEKELKDLSDDVKVNPDMLKREVEKAYWVVKGKTADSNVGKAEQRAIKKVTEDKKIIQSQPDRSTPSEKSIKGKLTTGEIREADAMGIPHDEYLKYKNKKKR